MYKIFTKYCFVIGWGLLITFAAPNVFAAERNANANTQGIDKRLTEIVEIVEQRVNGINETSLRGIATQSESELNIATKLLILTETKSAIYSKNPEQIRLAAAKFENYNFDNMIVEVDQIVRMYRLYADGIENNFDVESLQDVVEPFKSDGTWIEQYFAYVLSTYIYAENNQRQSALSAAQIALNIIPKHDDAYTRYAKSDVTALIAQLHNQMINVDLAIESSLDYLRLTRTKPDIKSDLDLINNLIFSLGVNRDHESAIYLSEALLNISTDETSEVPGFSEYRISQIMNMSGQFEKGLKYSRVAMAKSSHPFVAKESALMEAVATAGLGLKAEAKTMADDANIDLSPDHLLNKESSRDRLYLGYLLALGEDDDLSLKLYNRRIDVLSRKLLSASSGETSSMLAALENSRERQAERAAAAKREAALQALTIEKQRTLNRSLLILIGLMMIAFIALFAFLKYRERTIKALAIKTEEAASADKLKTEFLGLISHELRTPLNGIIGFSDLLSRTHADTDVRKKTAVILKSGQELLTVVEAMTDMARIDAGRLDILADDTNIPELMASTIQEIEDKAAAKGISFTAFIDPALQTHFVDGQRLEQCIKTLLSNAVSFTEEGRVHLHIKAKNDASDNVIGLEAVVVDTGVGMTELVQSRLFTPFMQADTSLRRSHMGTGLSLAIAKALIDLMGGTLSVVSRAGRGSEFKIDLPLAPVSLQAIPSDTVLDLALETVVETNMVDDRAPKTALPDPIIDLMQPRKSDQSIPLHAPQRVAETTVDHAGLRVLIVDDLPTNRDVIRDMLESNGCICFDASDGVEALEALRAGPIDIVIMDIHMNRMDGIEATKRIRESDRSYSEVPIIVVTADNDPSCNAKCMAAGADIFLTKPVLLDELQQSLDFLKPDQTRIVAPLDVLG